MANHAVKILGWGTLDDVDYWLCANSWGVDWADNGGFFMIQRGTNECSIESNIVAGKQKVDGSQPTPPLKPEPVPGPMPGPMPGPPGPSPLLPVIFYSQR